jgi:hypothetical protein
MQTYGKAKARSSRIVTQRVKNETLIYDLIENRAFHLNETSTLIWDYCDGNRSANEISRDLTTNTKLRVSEEVVILALKQFERDGLLDADPELTVQLAGFSRREIIKRAAVGAAVALPIVSGIVAPESAMAQSGAAALGGVCLLASPATCVSGNCLNSGGSGICCAAASAQANNPGYTICTADADASAFSVRCCSGSAAPAAVQACPNPADTRYTCGPY